MGARTLILLLGVLFSGKIVWAFASASGGLQVNLEVPEVIYDNQHIVFNCSIDGVGVVTTSWWLDESPLEGGSDGVLNVTVPLAWNGACLTCGVEGDTGIIFNASSVLTVAGRSPSLAEYPVSQTVNESASLLLTCRVLGLPTPSVYWERNGIIVTSFFQLSSAVLNISAASPEHSGIYTCTARNDVGIVTFPQVVIRVAFAPQIQISPESTDILNRNTATLSCVARGDPVPVISWEHNGVAVDTGDSGVSILPNGTLVIDMVMLTDMGDYQCFATNALGTTESDVVLLMVDVFPIFREQPSDMMVNLGTHVQLACSAYGIPEVEYFWFRLNGMTESPLELDSRVVEVNGTLNITMTSREDGGMYKCVAMNERGNITSVPVWVTILAISLPPVGLHGAALGSSWVQMKWNGDSSVSPPITKHLLEYKLPFELHWTSLADVPAALLRKNVTDLYPFATYQFRVAAFNSFGYSAVSDVEEVTTSAGAPIAGLEDQPEQVMVDSVSPESLNISWVVPQVLLQTAYLHTLLTVQNLTGSELFSEQLVARTSVVSGLRPATNYSVTVTLVFQGGEEGTPVTQLATLR